MVASVFINKELGLQHSEVKNKDLVSKNLSGVKGISEISRIPYFKHN